MCFFFNTILKFAFFLSPGALDLHAPLSRQHLRSELSVLLRQRLPVPAHQRRGGAHQAQRDSSLLRQVLPWKRARPRRAGVQGGTQAAAAAATAGPQTPYALSPLQPGVPLARVGQHPSAAAQGAHPPGPLQALFGFLLRHRGVRLRWLPLQAGLSAPSCSGRLRFFIWCIRNIRADD